MPRWDINAVNSLFAENGCELLDLEYKNARTPLRYRCICGTISRIRLDDFRRGKRCRECARRKLSDSKKMDVKHAADYFLTFGYRIESVSIRNGRQYFNYVCPKEHRGSIVFHSFQDGYRCAKCAAENSSERYRLSLDQVRQEFEAAGCLLLSTSYRNMNSRLKYRCSCGNTSHTYLSAIRKGIKCGCQRPRGEESPNWNPDLTDDDREANRNYPEYRDWLRLVYERDKYTCQKCGVIGGVLNAHHIKSYAKHKNVRTDVDNGITLCEPCHKTFHSIYGLKDFTEADLRDYLAQHADKLRW